MTRMKKSTIGNYIETAVDAAVLFRNTVKVAGSQEGFFVSHPRERAKAA